MNFTIVFIATIPFVKFEQPYLTTAGLPVSYLGVMYAMVAVFGLILSSNIAWLTARFSRKAIMNVSGIAIFLALIGASLFHSSIIIASFVFFVVRMMRTIRWPIYGLRVKTRPFLLKRISLPILSTKSS